MEKNSSTTGTIGAGGGDEVKESTEPQRSCKPAHVRVCEKRAFAPPSRGTTAVVESSLSPKTKRRCCSEERSSGAEEESKDSCESEIVPASKQTAGENEEEDAVDRKMASSRLEALQLLTNAIKGRRQIQVASDAN